MEGITVEEAIACMTEVVSPPVSCEVVAILEAVGRILAVEVWSEMDNPPFNRSAVDGYACCAADTIGANKENPVSLCVMEEIDAGRYSNVAVRAGEAVRIMTGAPIPEGCDCCIRQESTDYGEERVRIYEKADQYENYCFAGEDFKKGTCMLAEGTRLTYVEIGMLASLGYAEIAVYKQPSVVLFTTGDEVMLPGSLLLPGKIYNNNLYVIGARLREMGLRPIQETMLPDQEDQLAKALIQASETADLIITTGGVSVGKRDIVHEAIRLSGAKRIFWKVLLKPGAPTIFSTLNGVPIVSLTGNPFGALANFELLIRPMLAIMSMNPSLQYQRRPAIFKDEFPKPSKRRRMLRGRYTDGEVRLPDGLHSSGVFSSMQGCNCMIDIPAGTPYLSQGDTVEIILL